MSVMTTRRLVGVAEMAAILDVRESWIYNRSKVGGIPTVRVGRYLRFDPDAVLRYLAAEQEAERRVRGE